MEREEAAVAATTITITQTTYTVTQTDITTLPAPTTTELVFETVTTTMCVSSPIILLFQGVSGVRGANMRQRTATNDRLPRRRRGRRDHGEPEPGPGYGDALGVRDVASIRNCVGRVCIASLFAVHIFHACSCPTLENALEPLRGQRWPFHQDPSPYSDPIVFRREC